MKNNRRHVLCAAVGFFLLLVFTGCTGTGETKSIEGFVYDSCGGCFTDNSPCKPCKVVIGLEQYLSRQLDTQGVRAQYTVRVHNLLYEADREILAQRLPEKQGSEDYPLVFVGDKLLRGWPQIWAELPTLLGEKTPQAPDGEEITLVPSEKNTLVYFKMQGCRSCKQTENLLNSLEGSVPEILIYDLDEEGSLELFRAYCETYGVNHENASVPLVFVGDSALEGYEEISTFLPVYLEKGYGKDTYRVE